MVLRKTNKAVYIGIMAMLLMAVFVFTAIINLNYNNSLNVFSDEPPQELILGEEITNDDYGIPSSYLYNALIAAYNESNPLNPLNKVFVNMFENTTSLNLSDRAIYNLDGLSMLNLENLETLNLSNNNLSSLDILSLSYLTNLKSLNLFNNKFKSINITNLTKLEYLNLNRNELSQINLSSLTNAVVKLNFNKFTDFSKITLPGVGLLEHLTVELINNNITNLNQNLINNEKFNFVMGLQGVGLNVKEENETDGYSYLIKTTTPLLFYNLGSYENVVIKIINSNSEIVKEFNSGSELEEFNLPVGVYSVLYVDAVSNQSVYSRLDDELGVFKSLHNIRVSPKNPTYKFYIKGTFYDNYYNKVDNGDKIFIYSVDEGAQLLYSFDLQNWQEGNEMVLHKGGGEYYVHIKSVVDGISSDIVSITVKTSINANISDGLLFFLLLLFGLAVFIVFVIVAGFNANKKSIIKK